MANKKDKPQQAHDLLQAIYNGVTEAFDDIRHKVVEEPWFNYENGRTVTGDTPKRHEFYDTPSWARGADAWSTDQETPQREPQEEHSQTREHTQAQSHEIER